VKDQSTMTIVSPAQLKENVKSHWESEVCGSRYAADSAEDQKKYFEQTDRVRYELEPMLIHFAQFDRAKGKRVLEIGLGTGADFSRWVRAGAIAFGRDLTHNSISLIQERLTLGGLSADIATGDAENLREFPDNYFDIYYSWGVLHHTSDTEKALREAHRVLRPGGQLKLMLYHYPSVGSMLIWMLYGPLRFNFQGPRTCLAEHYESPGTKMYTVGEARGFLGKLFTTQPIDIRLSWGGGPANTQVLA
jgi:SAM-dependent methyltransferase